MALERNNRPFLFHVPSNSCLQRTATSVEMWTQCWQNQWVACVEHVEIKVRLAFLIRGKKTIGQIIRGNQIQEYFNLNTQGIQITTSSGTERQKYQLIIKYEASALKHVLSYWLARLLPGALHTDIYGVLFFLLPCIYLGLGGGKVKTMMEKSEPFIPIYSGTCRYYAHDKVTSGLMKYPSLNNCKNQ